MTDPCETCVRWSECNGVEAASCPYYSASGKGTKQSALPFPINPVEIAAFVRIASDRRRVYVI